MSEIDGSLDFKVIKRIPLSKSITQKYQTESKVNRLEKMDVSLPYKKETKTVPLEYQGVKKVDLKIDVSDISEHKKPFNPFEKEKVKEKIIVKEATSLTPKEDLILKEETKPRLMIEEHSKFFSNNQLMIPEHKELLDISLNKRSRVKSTTSVQNKVSLNNKSQKNISSFVSPEKNISVIDKVIKKDLSLDYSINNDKSMNILKEILKEVSQPFKESPLKNNSKDDFYESFKNKSENVDSLLEELNKKTDKLNEDVFLEVFSFLDDKPKMKKVEFNSYNVKNLYSKIDALTEHKKETVTSVKETSFKEKQTSAVDKIDYNIKKESLKYDLLEEIDVPDMYAIEDDSSNMEDVIDRNFISQVNSEQEKITDLNNDSKMVSIVKTNEASEKIPNFVMDNNQVKLNEEIKKNITRVPLKKEEKFNIDSFSQKINEEQASTQKTFSEIKFTPEDDQKLQLGIKQIIETPQIVETTTVKRIKENPRVKKDLIAEKFKDLRDKGIDYILPKDAGKNPIKINKEIYQEELSSDNSLFSSLVYNDPILTFKKDITTIYDKYSIDDFTYVTIYYDQELGLFYNLVQPDLSAEQEKEYQQLKRIFFNTIDKNYYSFNGDKHSLNKYIEKIYDISLDKLSYRLGNLQQKLYLKFIQREFFGLGILTNLLQDKKILEVSCSGEKSTLSIMHVEYGLLKTNISFPDINELNKFVLILTKNMGLYITQAHPVIDGYLPNGYKVEGLYSVGDTSSKGSSFVIKKYLEEPLTPVSLINTSVGSVDVFSYIWSAIAENYKVVIIDTDDSFIIFNSILLFLPEKKIITVQAYDRFKLPQKEWVNRVFTSNQDLNKKLMIEQTISQKPDYIVVDEFSKDVFDVSWYNINLFSINPDVADQFLDQLKVVNQKSIVIELKRINQGIKEVLQIMNIREIVNKKESLVVDIDLSEDVYAINLLSSSINVVDFLKRKKIMRWMRDSKIYSYKDFNSIVSQYYFEKDNLFKKLDIK